MRARPHMGKLPSVFVYHSTVQIFIDKFNTNCKNKTKKKKKKKKKTWKEKDINWSENKHGRKKKGHVLTEKSQISGIFENAILCHYQTLCHNQTKNFWSEAHQNKKKCLNVYLVHSPLPISGVSVLLLPGHARKESAINSCKSRLAAV